MKKRMYPVYRRFFAVSDWLEKRITPQGSYLSIILSLLLIFGLNTEKTMLFSLIAFSFVLHLFSIIACRFIKIDITVVRHFPEICSNGKEFFYVLTIKNCSRKKISGLFVTEIPANPAPSLSQFLMLGEKDEKKRNRFDQLMGYYRWSWLIEKNKGADFSQWNVPEIGAGETIDFRVSLTPKRRGYIYLSGIRAFQKDLFGFFQKGVFFNADARILSFPALRTIELAPDLLPNTQTSVSSGSVESMRKGLSEVFLGVRDYQSGDMFKHIHWKLFAKTGNLVIREFSEEQQINRAVILDSYIGDSEYLFFEAAVEVAASVVVALGKVDEPPDLLICGLKATRYDRNLGSKGIEYLVRELAVEQISETDNFSELLQKFKTIIDQLQRCIVVTARVDQSVVDFIVILSKYGVEPLLFVPKTVMEKKECAMLKTYCSVSFFDIA